MSGDGAAGAVVIAVIVAGTFVWQRVWYPHRTCTRCNGTGKIRLGGTNRFADCRKCKATGELRRGQ